MAICANCGEQVQEGAKSCAGCGAECPEPVQQQYIQQTGYQQQNYQQPSYQQPDYQQQNFQPPSNHLQDYQVHGYQPPQYPQPQYAPAPFFPEKKNGNRTLISAGIVVISIVLVMAGVIWLLNQLGDPPDFDRPPLEAFWIGLWRYGEGEDIELFHAKMDGTFQVDIYNTKDGSHDVIRGRYEISEFLRFTAFDVTFNGEASADGFSAAFNTASHTVTIGGNTFNRVSSENVEAVLADPTAPYPPDS